MKTLDTQAETQVVAMIARGDTYQSIIDRLKEKGVSISMATLTNIKGRNAEALDFMKKSLVERETTQTGQILEKSRRLLERKVDRALTVDDKLKELKGRLDTKEIEWPEYIRLLEIILKSEMTPSEVTSLSKEMFNQSQIEQGKPTVISNDPVTAREKLSRLLLSVKSGDEVKMLEAYFDEPAHA